MENQLLQKMQSSYKLIIPQKVEDKIRTLLAEIYNTEWSGVLFYTYEGSFENDDLVLTCQDILLMNVGNAVFTSFSIDEDVAAYMVDHDLLDCQMGLVHSHHNMQTFFSGTDTNTLYEEGKERNNFLSLIVNNAKDYSACITEKEVRRITKRVKSIIPFFGDCTKEQEGNEEKGEEILVKYYPLYIEIEGGDGELLDRIKEIKKKELEKPTKVTTVENWSRSDLDYPGSDFDLDKKYPKESYLFDPTPYTKVAPKSDLESPEICPEEVEQLVAQLITGNILAQDMPKNLEKALPFINKMWEKALEQDGMLVETLVNAVIAGRANEDDLRQACADRLEELFPKEDFFPMSEIIDNLLYN